MSRLKSSSTVSSSVQPGVGGSQGDLAGRSVQTAVPGPVSTRLRDLRGQHCALSLGEAHPVFVHRGQGSLLEDVDGNVFIDLTSGYAVTNIGHSRPELVRAVQDQLERFTHTNFAIAAYESYVEVCRRLNELTPGDMPKKTALFTTGAEAVENSIKLARRFTGRTKVVSFDHAFHGRTNMAMSLSAKESPYKTGFGPFSEDVVRAPYPYPFRSTDSAAQTLERVVSIITAADPSTVAAIIIEPIAAEGGVLVPPDEFLVGLADFARQQGIVLVADEIQTGFGRTGRLFASDHSGLVPDLILLGKGLAGGMPISAVTGRAEILDATQRGGIGGTFAGSPASCAAALATIEVLLGEDLARQATVIEGIVRDGFGDAVRRDPRVGDVRGRGALMGVELVTADGHEPDPRAAEFVVSYARDRGVLTLASGAESNVLRLLPSLVIEESLLKDALAVIDEALAAWAALSEDVPAES